MLDYVCKIICAIGEYVRVLALFWLSVFAFWFKGLCFYMIEYLEASLAQKAFQGENIYFKPT